MPLAHLGVFSAMYVASSLAVIGTLSGVRVPPAAYAIAFLTAHATYLLDRVKLRDMDLDPSDLVAHPERAAFVRGHARVCRSAVLGSAVAAIVVALMTVPLASVLVPASLFGVLVYARSKRHWQWRPKDVLALKNPSVALAITAFAIALVLIFTDRPFLEALRAVALPAIFLAMHVFADAVLCDIDDTHADGCFGTRTVPVTVGRRAAERLALAVKLLAVSIPAILMWLSSVSAAAAIVWMVVPTLTAIALLFVWRGRYRDAVDLSLPLAAVVAVGIGFFFVT